MLKKKVAKVVGFFSLCSLVLPIVNFVFFQSGFISEENPESTYLKILDDEVIFRVGIVNEFICSSVITGFAVSLYSLLKDEDENIALLALCLKLFESFLFSVIAFCHYVSIKVLSDKSGKHLEEMKTLIGIFFNEHIPLTAAPGIFLGLSMTLFCYLLFRSKFVPRSLSSLGVLSYVLVFVYDSMTIIAPNYSTVLIIQLVFTVPICLFQIIFGFWLLFKGILETDEVCEEKNL